MGLQGRDLAMVTQIQRKIDKKCKYSVIQKEIQTVALDGRDLAKVTQKTKAG